MKSKTTDTLHKTSCAYTGSSGEEKNEAAAFLHLQREHKRVISIKPDAKDISHRRDNKPFALSLSLSPLLARAIVISGPGNLGRLSTS